MNTLETRDLRNRMLTARGHLAAIVAMMDRDLPCAEIVEQVLAVRGATRAIHRALWRAYLLDPNCGLRSRSRKTRTQAWQALKTWFALRQPE